MHLAHALIQSNLHCIQATHFSHLSCHIYIILLASSMVFNFCSRKEWKSAVARPHLNSQWSSCLFVSILEWLSGKQSRILPCSDYIWHSYTLLCHAPQGCHKWGKLALRDSSHFWLQVALYNDILPTFQYLDWCSRDCHSGQIEGLGLSTLSYTASRNEISDPSQPCRLCTWHRDW